MGEYTREMDSDLEQRIQGYISKREKAQLSPYATLSSDGVRRTTTKREDIRAVFSRDADRILHTRAYARYIDKTQVFYCVDNDHITHRVLHVQMVSKIGRTIGRALRLNEDLIEAIAIGHDIGHAPFGHTGEKFLSNICQRRKVGYFKHNLQSVKFLDAIEVQNLTLQVLDGILCHNGEVHHRELRPDRGKSWDDFDREMGAVRSSDIDPHPMTLEGCVVRVADVIAYLGRDIQDAIELGIIAEDQLPEDCSTGLGSTNADIINSLVIDLVEKSYEQDFLRFSAEVSDLLDKYRRFNYDHIYKDTRITREHPKIKEMYEILFKRYVGDLRRRNLKSRVFRDFVLKPWVSASYLTAASNVEVARDFIAGMTDRYFETAFLESVLPLRRSNFKDVPEK